MGIISILLISKLRHSEVYRDSPKMTQIFCGKERPDPRFALGQIRASEQLESHIMEKAGAIVRMYSLSWAWGLTHCKRTFSYWAALSTNLLCSPQLTHSSTSISRALGIMMDGGDMLIIQTPCLPRAGDGDTAFLDCPELCQIEKYVAWECKTHLTPSCPGNTNGTSQGKRTKVANLPTP